MPLPRSKPVKKVPPLQCGAELFFGLTAPIGTDLDTVTNILEEILKDFDYQCSVIHLVELLHELPRWRNLPEIPLEKRYFSHMNAGDDFCKILNRASALAAFGISNLQEERSGITGDASIPAYQRAYIFRSLKRPDEVTCLRSVYGRRFFQIGAYSPREVRMNNLSRRIASSHHSNRSERFRDCAEQLDQRDQEGHGIQFGQNVQNAFPLADIFVDASNAMTLRLHLRRFVEMLFRSNLHTPTKDEYGMFHAHAASMRSSSTSRQVGAVIVDDEGEILASGVNEVPKAGGGQYWCHDEPNGRDFVRGYDTSKEMRRNTLAELLEHLRKAQWLSREKQSKKTDVLVSEALKAKFLPSYGSHRQPLVEGTQLMDLIEFGRAEHAEMSAILGAARRGIPIKGATLFCTTFPCHDCARHIITSGIKKVVYIQPYPKSLALELHKDAIALDDPDNSSSKSAFVPFVGISPRRYQDLFLDSGEIWKNRRKSGTPKPHLCPDFEDKATFYLTKEKERSLQLLHLLITNKLCPPVSSHRRARRNRR